MNTHFSDVRCGESTEEESHKPQILRLKRSQWKSLEDKTKEEEESLGSSVWDTTRRECFQKKVSNDMERNERKLIDLEWERPWDLEVALSVAWC